MNTSSSKVFSSDTPTSLAYQGVDPFDRASVQQSQSRSGIRQWFTRYGMTLHRWVSIIALIPALLWSLSGTSHPFMSHWFKPTIAREFLPPMPIRPEALALGLDAVLTQQGISIVKQARIVQLASEHYYQVQLPSVQEHVYLNTKTGERLQDGDRQYAIALAKQYLGNPNATVRVTTLITEFNDDYRYVNRLLPVWKVSFAEGEYDVYVETSSGRMATYNTPLRIFFLRAFQYLHNWGWLNGAEFLRLSIITIALTVILIASLSGIVMYMFLWRKRRSTPAQGIRKYHRSIGIAVSLSTLMFASSGLYHALHKDRFQDDRKQIDHATYAGVIFSPSELSRIGTILANMRTPIFDIALVRLHSTPYLRVTHGVSPQTGTDDCCTILSTPVKQESNSTQQSTKPQQLRGATLIDLATAQPLSRGDERYASFVATQLCSFDPQSVVGTQLVTEFKGEYGFINKRLPVWRVNLATPDHRSVYIEPQTATLSADISDSDRKEGFVFAYIHKLEFLKPLGKDIRDGTAVALGLLNSTVAVLGLILFLRIKR